MKGNIPDLNVWGREESECLDNRLKVFFVVGEEKPKPALEKVTTEVVKRGRGRKMENFLYEVRKEVRGVLN
jgi:hypothetical protein